jgi:dihydrofolate reductase
MIAATDKNGLIGNNGKLPWNIPEDMNFFKKITTNNIVVMGRKTYISIDKPLKNRVNVIISTSILENFNRDKPIQEYNSDLIVLKSFDQINDEYFTTNYSKDIFIIGGRSIYKQSFDQAIPEKLLISRIDGEFEGNEFLPDIPENYSFAQSFRISERVMVDEYRRNY